MIYVYGFCDINSVHAVAEYQWRFPSRRIPTWRVFTWVYGIPVHFPAFALQPSVMLMKVSMKKKALFRWYSEVRVQVHEELQDVFVFPTRERGEHCMQRACIHTTCSESKISDLAIFLRGWNFASSPMAVASCIVTSCLLTKRNSINTVLVRHNSHVWVDDNPHATVESNFKLRFIVNLWCAVLDDQLIGPFILEGRLTGFCRRNCPDFWRMCLWINEVICISNMTELLLILRMKLEISWTVVSLGNGSDVAVPTIGQPGLQT